MVVGDSKCLIEEPRSGGACVRILVWLIREVFSQLPNYDPVVCWYHLKTCAIIIYDHLFSHSLLLFFFHHSEDCPKFIVHVSSMTCFLQRFCCPIPILWIERGCHGFLRHTGTGKTLAFLIPAIEVRGNPIWKWKHRMSRWWKVVFAENRYSVLYIYIYTRCVYVYIRHFVYIAHYIVHNRVIGWVNGWLYIYITCLLFLAFLDSWRCEVVKPCKRIGNKGSWVCIMQTYYHNHGVGSGKW